MRATPNGERNRETSLFRSIPMSAPSLGSFPLGTRHDPQSEDHVSSMAYERTPRSTSPDSCVAQGCRHKENRDDRIPLLKRAQTPEMPPAASPEFGFPVCQDDERSPISSTRNSSVPDAHSWQHGASMVWCK